MTHEQAVSNLAAIIYFVASILPRGPLVVLGSAREPTTKDYSTILEVLQPSSNDPFGPRSKYCSPKQEALDLLCKTEDICDRINEHGGWSEIARNAREFKRENPAKWLVFKDIAECRGMMLAASEHGIPESLAIKHKIDVQTALQYKSEVPRVIAERTIARTQRMF